VETATPAATVGRDSHLFLDLAVRRVRFVAALAVACAQDVEPGDPQHDICSSSAYVELLVGGFGPAPDALEEHASVLVWRPIQGGVVVGLSLLLTGVPAGVAAISLSVRSEPDDVLIATYDATSVRVRCIKTGYAAVDRLMVAVFPELEEASLDGMKVLIRSAVRFTATTGAAIAMRRTFRGTLLEGSP
jgi:hypothetical protein